MLSYERDYSMLIEQAVRYGEKRVSRVGPTRQLFGTQLAIDCLENNEFPILTARKMHPKPIFGELAAFLAGATLLQTFKDFGCNYWDDNAAAWFGNLGLTKDKFSVGAVYGAQWRCWGRSGMDQIEELLHGLRAEPTSRRHVLTTWNPEELHLGCLPPCHILAQFNVTNDGHIDCMVTMRSVDLCLGLPTDVALYAALLILVSKECNKLPGRLVFNMGDTHVYEEHIEEWEKMVKRPWHKLPSWKLDEAATVNSFFPSQLTLVNYDHSFASTNFKLLT